MVTRAYAERSPDPMFEYRRRLDNAAYLNLTTLADRECKVNDWTPPIVAATWAEYINLRDKLDAAVDAVEDAIGELRAGKARQVRDWDAHVRQGAAKPKPLNEPKMHQAIEDGIQLVAATKRATEAAIKRHHAVFNSDETQQFVREGITAALPGLHEDAVKAAQEAVKAVRAINYAALVVNPDHYDRPESLRRSLIVSRDAVAAMETFCESNAALKVVPAND